MNQAMMNNQVYGAERNEDVRGENIHDRNVLVEQKPIVRAENMKLGEFAQAMGQTSQQKQQNEHVAKEKKPHLDQQRHQTEKRHQQKKREDQKLKKGKAEAKKESAGEPSGWEMLFGGGGEGSGDVEDERRDSHTNASSGSNENDHGNERKNLRQKEARHDQQSNRNEMMRKQRWGEPDFRNGKRPVENGWNMNENIGANHANKGLVPENSQMQEGPKRARNGWGVDNELMNNRQPDGGGGRPGDLDHEFGGQRVGAEYGEFTEEGLDEREPNGWNGGSDGEIRGGANVVGPHAMGYGNEVVDNNGLLAQNMNMMGGMAMGVGNGADMNGNMNMMADPNSAGTAGVGAGGVGGMSAAAAAAAAMGMFGEPETIQALHQQMMQQQQVAWQQQHFQQQAMQQQALLMQMSGMVPTGSAPNNNADNSNNDGSNGNNKNMGGGGGWYTGGFDQQIAAAAAGANVAGGFGDGGNGFMNDGNNQLNMGGNGGNVNGQQWGGDRSRGNRQFRNPRGRSRGRSGNRRR